MGRTLKNKETREQIREQTYARADQGILSPQEAVKGIRKMSGLTQAEFAKRIGISVATLKSIEQGTANPRVSTLQKILALGRFRLTVGRISKLS
jgi:DNA-binding XRE family transcriptional regulator